MKHISLFSGIEGFSIAAELAGWTNIVSCEINPFGSAISKHYWPDAYHHDDIKTLNYGTINIELTRRFGVDWKNDGIIITGGFPCQPFSVAGKRKGTEDERHLWPEMLRVIREVKPTWVVGENVFGIVNWSGGLVFEQVQSDLEAEGYEVQPYVLPACGVNAPHRRDRVWFVGHRIDADTRLFGQEIGQKQSMGFEQLREERDVADTDSNGHELREHREDRQSQGEGEDEFGERERIRANIGGIGEQRDAPYTEIEQSKSEQFGQRIISEQGTRKFRGDDSAMGYGGIVADTMRRRQPGEKHGEAQPRFFAEEGFFDNWRNFPTQPPVRRGNDGLSESMVRAYFVENSGGVLTEKEIDRLVQSTFSKFYKEAIKSFGNAIVPQVAYQIFRAINEYTIYRNESRNGI